MKKLAQKRQNSFGVLSYNFTDHLRHSYTRLKEKVMFSMGKKLFLAIHKHKMSKY